MATAAPQTSSVSFFDEIRVRQAQARRARDGYLGLVADRNSMLFWLARACKEARIAAGRKIVHVAASASVDQSTIFRYEQQGGWPRDPDIIVNAYADDLDVDPLRIWQEAMAMWAADRDLENATSLPEELARAFESQEPASHRRPAGPGHDGAQLAPASTPDATPSQRVGLPGRRP